MYGWAHAAQLGLPEKGAYSTESDPRIPEPYASQLFYYAQADALTRLSAGKTWRFTELRPNDIIGFVPGGNNAMNFAQSLGLFLAFYASKNSNKSSGRPKLAFPSSPTIWNAHISDVSQRTLGRAHLFASNLQSANGESFNIADAPSKIGTTWSEKWPQVCEYFGIEGVGPGEVEGQTWGAVEYMRMHENEWDAWEKSKGLRSGIFKATGWEFLEIILQMAVFDRIYDQDKFAEAGFNQTHSIPEAYREAFQIMEEAKILPSKSNL